MLDRPDILLCYVENDMRKFNVVLQCCIETKVIYLFMRISKIELF